MLSAGIDVLKYYSRSKIHIDQGLIPSTRENDGKGVEIEILAGCNAHPLREQSSTTQGFVWGFKREVLFLTGLQMSLTVYKMV